ncbi:MAG: PD-(D/E)XK nuclease family protein [Candidatus Magasanikbacteria bacterium]|nr:PD-(D/E)XK nuclease family protein [Candidatus Magasanikbacteria bacterium]
MKFFLYRLKKTGSPIKNGLSLYFRSIHKRLNAKKTFDVVVYKPLPKAFFYKLEYHAFTFLSNAICGYFKFMSKYALNKAQTEAVEYTTGPLLIVAGAGTGKTTVITEKICYLLEKGLAKPEEILALVFNDKASLEIQERTDERLETGYTELAISTFHAFCQRLLERHAIDIGLSGQFELLSQTAAWLLMRKNLNKFNLDYYCPAGNPSKHIHELLKHFSKCKDELITPAEYLAYAENIKLNDDRDPSASPLRKGRAIPRLGGVGVGEVNMSRNEIARLTEIASAYHTYNQLLLDTNRLDFGDLIFYVNKLFAERPQILERYQKQFKYILVDEFQDVNWAQFNLIRTLAGDGSPLEGGLTGGVSLLRGRSPQIDDAKVLHPHYPPRGGGANGAQLTVVGDDDQSIYAFRGASVSNILRFKDEFPESKEIVLNENYRSNQTILDTAYKSIQNNNPDRLEVKLKIDKKLIAKKPLVISTTKEKSLAHSNDARDSSTALRSARNDKEANAVVHLHSATLEQEVREVVWEIARLKQIDETATWDDFAILVRANSHAEPFLHSLEAQGIPYEFLAASGLYRQPVVLDCYNYFKAINDHFDSNAVFRLLRMPFLGIKENDIQKFTSFAKKKANSYYETLKRCREIYLSAEGVAACDTLVSLIHDGMKQARALKPSILLYYFLDNSGYLNYLKEQEEAGNRDIIRQNQHLKQFFDYLESFEKISGDSHISNFLEEFSGVLESGDRGAAFEFSETSDSVNVMTVHRSKGLEFKYVFVVNLVEERFPTRTKGDGIEIPLPLVKEQLPEGDIHYEEERRLFYVAMTRAKERLYFSSATSYGGVRGKKLSRFLAELDYTASDKPVATSELAERKIVEPVTEHIVYDMPKSFSFSHIQMYQTCPYKYKLAHVLSLPQKGSHYFSFGTSIHSTLQAFYIRVQELNAIKQTSLFDAPPPIVISTTKEKSLAHQTTDRDPSSPRGSLGMTNGNDKALKVPALDELLKIYETKFIDDWYKSATQKEQYFKKGKEVLKTFYAAESKNWHIPIFLESFFKIKIGGHLLSGRIDRVDKLPDGSLEIIDYKTGRAKKKLTTDDKEQLLIYQIAAEQLPEYKNIGKPSKLTFYYLEEEIKSSFIGDNKDLERVQATIMETVNKIKSQEFTASPSQFSCEHCDFRDICEFRI